jgi:excisionase family DNA binding protein
MDAPRYLDVAGAAGYLSISTSYLSKLVSRRKIPFLKIGRLVRFDRSALDRWIGRRQVFPRGWATSGDEKVTR